MIPLYLFFFVLETYHAVTHFIVLAGWRMLPRKDLVKSKNYFFIDTGTVFITSFFVLRKLEWLATLQIVQHLVIIYNWDTHPYTKKIINWSSLEWKKSRFSLPDIAIGTSFDLMVHSIHAVLLSFHLSQFSMIVGLAVVAILTKAVVYNPRYAWSDPKNIPKWVEKRLQPLK